VRSVYSLESVLSATQISPSPMAVVFLASFLNVNTVLRFKFAAYA